MLVETVETEGGVWSERNYMTHGHTLLYCKGIKHIHWPDGYDKQYHISRGVGVGWWCWFRARNAIFYKTVTHFVYREWIGKYTCIIFMKISNNKLQKLWLFRDVQMDCKSEGGMAEVNLWSWRVGGGGTGGGCNIIKEKIKVESDNLYSSCIICGNKEFYIAILFCI